jgi:general bacterial porin, GBP family
LNLYPWLMQVRRVLQLQLKNFEETNVNTRNLMLASIMALPILGWAQSAVTIGGVIDAGVRLDRGATGGGQVSVGSGLSNGSRLTFTGLEDLGGGLRAVFVLEAGVAMDTGAGTANPPGGGTALTFGRTSAVGIGSERTGYITLGRQYTPLFSVSANPMSDPFIGSWLGGSSVVYSNTVRASNSIVYSYGYGPTTMLRPAPRSGFGFSAIYAPAEATGQSPGGAGMQYGLAATYGRDGWWAGLAHHRVKGNDDSINPALPTTPLPLLKQQTLSAGYDFGAVRLGAGINTATNDATGAAHVNRRSYTVSAYVPIGSNQVLRALYGQMKNRAAANSDVNTFQVGYQYNFSKRTSVYAAYGYVDNDSATAVALSGSLGAYAAGSRPRSLITGVLHTF